MWKSTWGWVASACRVAGMRPSARSLRACRVPTFVRSSVFNVSLLLMAFLDGSKLSRGPTGPRCELHRTLFEKGTDRLVAVDVHDRTREQRRDRDHLEVLGRLRARRDRIGDQEAVDRRGVETFDGRPDEQRVR